ncbi:MAG TPA: hypothetical protein VNK95_21690 [Caldilineaceae bacterium]|nr:hypothetical protein [Caldilineaceae bacterium]
MDSLMEIERVDSAAEPENEPPPEARPARLKGNPPPTFNWAIYADATLAGLSALIPIPFIDSLFEEYFRRRMIHTIAHQRSRALHPAAVRALNQNPLMSSARKLLTLPLTLTIGLLVRLSRKLLYFLSIRRAVNLLTYYWRRAYLLDYMVRQGHLSAQESAAAAVAALDAVLVQSGSGPFRWLAQHVVNHTPHVIRTLWHARHGQEDPPMLTIRAELAARWPALSDYLATLARRYDEQFETMHRLSRLRRQHHYALHGQLQEG